MDLEMYQETESLVNYLAVLSSIFLIFAALGLVFYILMGLGVYKLAKNNKLENDAFWAFVPFLNVYVLGKLVEEKVHVKLRGYMGTINISLVLISIFFQPFALIQYAFFIYTLFFVYKKFSDKYLTLFILSIVSFGLFVPFFLFSIRNNKEVGIETEIENEIEYSDNLIEENNEIIKDDTSGDHIEQNKKE